MYELINTALLGGVFFTGLFWVVRTIKKSRDDKRNSNPIRVSNS
jgi:hypothetical protein